MKRYIAYILIIPLLTTIMAGCDEETTDNVSEVTHFPEFEMTASEYYFIDQGSSFEEPGIQAFAGEDEVEVETSGSVDESTPGVYTLTYTATNADGYSKSIERKVIVTAGDVSQSDLSGTYSGGYYGDATMTVTRIKDGLYESTDIFGYGDPYPITGIIVDLGNGELVVLSTSSAFGPTLKSTGTYTDTELSYVLGIEGYGYIFDTVWTRQQT